MDKRQCYELRLGNGKNPLAFRSHDIANIYACVVSLKKWFPALWALDLSEVMEALVTLKYGKITSYDNSMLRILSVTENG